MHITLIILALVVLAVSASGAPFEAKLSTGTLYVPDGYAPSKGKIDLVFHLHGSPDTVKKSFIESRRAAALVIVAFDGLSGAYSDPFGKDKKLFGKILDEARGKIAEHNGLKSVEIRTLVVSSFSAGFGAVREITPIPEYLNKINALIMLDSIYAGYVQENGKDVVDPENMPPFELMATRAAQGKASMWITHSEGRPGSYASTTETAEFLARKVGAKIEPSDGKVDATGMKLLSKADLKGFHVRGYPGTDGPAHWSHLAALGVFLRQTGLKAL